MNVKTMFTNSVCQIYIIIISAIKYIVRECPAVKYGPKMTWECGDVIF